MKTYINIMGCVALLITVPAYAEHADHNHEEEVLEPSGSSMEGAACQDIIKVKVNGLVCDFCARALEKVFSRREEVAGIQIDLDNGLVAVAVKSSQTIDDETLTQLITDSGYNITAIDKGC